ncbi:DUF1758 domain-containing protein [Trichonephila inaurata madagascariensis]|uniref:DUF1758 domain-containing protein n=1 Tax=Trichonephila inaurata madagascariensis TaxID=2747483 RepID=A0A8X6MHL9_9ARAC|nr:DUF1758 domain-containing protein [Trichonephila inaurata madagascariensis]
MEGAGAIESDETLSVSGAEKIETINSSSENIQNNAEGSSSNALVTQPPPLLAPPSLMPDAVINNPSEPQTIQTFSSLNKSSNKFVFLSAAIVSIWSPVLHNYVRGRVILDSASQSHFKTLQFASKLGLEKKKLTLLFDEPGKIDMIIGAELFYQIIKDGRKVISDNLTLINSVFGFIVSGSINTTNHKSSCFLISESESIDNCIKKFWEIEEIILDKPLSKEEEFCEMHFRNTHRRDCTGQFIVYMPVQDEELPTLVLKIQALTANYQWKHISSRDNPADLISRGVNPSDLEHLEFWWSGPSSAMEEIMDDSRQNDLNPSEKELYLTELKTVTSTNLILSSDSNFINQIL